MLSPAESQAALRLIRYNADQSIRAILAGLTGTPQQILQQLLEIVPELVSYYGDGSAVLASDLFDELRDIAAVRGRFQAEPIVLNRTDKIRNAVVWATASDRSEDRLADLQARVTADRAARIAGTTEQRLVDIVTDEVTRPYRETILTNTHRDAEAVGWSRVAGDSCGFCRMLSARGAVYRSETARFAAHGHCDCTARPEFRGEPMGPEASVMQYAASRRRKTPGQRAALRSYLEAYYPD